MILALSSIFSFFLIKGVIPFPPLLEITEPFLAADPALYPPFNRDGILAPSLSTIIIYINLPSSSNSSMSRFVLSI